MRGITRIIFVPRTSTRILLFKISVTSIVSKLFNSQEREVNEKGLEVGAPTGHESITLPDNSDFKRFSI